MDPLSWPQWLGYQRRENNPGHMDRRRLHRRTGKEHWKIPREGQHACYATPCLNTTSSRPAELIFSHCYEGITGVDLATGKQNWHVDPFGRDDQRALVSPIIAGDLVIAGSGAAGATSATMLSGVVSKTH